MLIDVKLPPTAKTGELELNKPKEVRQAIWLIKSVPMGTLDKVCSS